MKLNFSRKEYFCIRLFLRLEWLTNEEVQAIAQKLRIGSRFGSHELKRIDSVVALMVGLFDVVRYAVSVRDAMRLRSRDEL